MNDQPDRIQRTAIHALVYLLTAEERGLILRSWQIEHPNVVLHFDDISAIEILNDAMSAIQLRQNKKESV